MATDTTDRHPRQPAPLPTARDDTVVGRRTAPPDVSRRSRFYPLYLTRFVGSLGFTLLPLLPTYIEQLGATGVTAACS